MKYFDQSVNTLRKGSISVAILFNVLLLTSVATSFAEEPATISVFYCTSDEIPFIGEIFPPVAAIIEDPKVKADLGLSLAQIEKLREMDKSFTSGIRALQHMKKEDDRSSVRSPKASFEYVMVGDMIEDSRKRTREVLKPRQLELLKQLLMQRGGLLSIPNREIQQVLRFDKNQVRTFGEIRSAVFRKIDDTTPQNLAIVFGDRCKYVNPTSPKLAPFLAESEKAAFRMLNPEQKKSVEKMLGK